MSEAKSKNKFKYDGDIYKKNRRQGDILKMN